MNNGQLKTRALELGTYMNCITGLYCSLFIVHCKLVKFLWYFFLTVFIHFLEIPTDRLVAGSISGTGTIAIN
jgi:hypothetical protein